MARIFLLGGYDLEMLEIKKILKEAGEKFIDKKLSWGASLSTYKDVFNDEDTFVGIELEVDMKPPTHYIEIDHHGKNAYKKSSIEQIAKMLGISLKRWQKLVAANDARYISGLKQLCATKEEIEQIRYADRKAQGVSAEDEKLAEESLVSLDESYIVYSKTQHFSAVSDRIYDKFTHYIIYNDKKVLFYGFSIEKLLLFLGTKQILPKHYYYGGGDFGFLGIKEGVLDSEAIKQLIKEFIQMQNSNKKVVSYHTFMLPFTFEGNFLKKDNWIYKPFQIETNKDYNEYVYFYKHVQDALFNTAKEDFTAISNYYEYYKQKGSFIIDSQVGKYTLQLDGISVRIFNTDVAILSFNLINDRYCNPKEILAINDFGRRIYPQFLGEKFSLKEPKEVILANEIILRFDDGEEFREDFCTLCKKEKVEIEKLSLLPNYIDELIKGNFTNSDKLRPIIDDRMFVISQYNNDTLGKKLQKFDEEMNSYAYETSDVWYEYVFVDGNGKSCQSRHMSKKFIAESTYDRWVEYGTLFGISRYSFVALSGGEFGQKTLNAHMRTLYFQMFTLLLAYRATIIKFSDEIQDTTNATENIAKKTREIYKKYLNFLNKLYFKEITAQDQGIELYNKAMQVMDIPKYMTDLDNEMNELHSYVDMLEEKKTANTMNTLTYLGGILLPPSIVTGFLGMNTLGGLEKYAWFDKSEAGVWSVVAIILSALIVPVWLKFFKKGAS